ncbi:peptidase C39 family protein [Crossiella sp. CA198]|uniref:peptidase C39 family protein n=1 Tax=Crossiella sp. CA198 TaxID=3455607 RepID=UPI003F8D1171
MRRLLVTLLAALCAALAAPATATAGKSTMIDFHAWQSVHDFHQGANEGTAPTPAGLTLARPAGTSSYADPHTGKTRDYEYARWTSARRTVSFPATELVASWNATTPADTWLQIELRGRGGGSTVDSKWYVLGRWAAADSLIKRTTVPNQGDANGFVDVDTFKAAKPWTSYQLRVTLYRVPGSTATPKLTMVGAMASAIPDRFIVPTSGPGGAWGMELPVPRYSQNLHRGNFPEYGGGGEVWCSPTSTQMVLEYWGRKPSAEQMSWIPKGYTDPTVAYAARNNYDYDYEGTGNWPFNTAYAASFGLAGHITRLGSLTELERYIRQGIPVITSQSFLASELDGAGYGTSGHIMVVVGFTRTGDVIANDPASPNNPAVRHVYKRTQFENIWQRTKRYRADGSVASGPGGIAYVIHPRWLPLP